mmetsp:Transcript_81299/g.230747  ORF Transcript_81299/g.230747 Transcript_81299/m.230747 type:complete len:656 (-) Transcript_81299:184-2151(-)
MGKKSRKGGGSGSTVGTGVAAAPAADRPLQVGDACLVHSLVAGDYWNGATGVIVKVDPEEEGPDGRIVVGVAFGQGNREKKRIRRRNLRPHAQALTWGPGDMGMGGMKIFTGVSVGGPPKKKAYGAAIARCMEAEPWKMSRSGNTCIGARLLAPSDSTTPDTIARQLCLTTVGSIQAAGATGLAIFQSYAHFRNYLLDQGQQNFMRSLPLWLSMGGNFSGGWLGCNRANPPDEDEIKLIFGICSLLPDFQKGLLAKRTPPLPWTIPLGYGTHSLRETLRFGDETVTVELTYPAVAEPTTASELTSASGMRHLPAACKILGTPNPTQVPTMGDLVAWQRARLSSEEASGAGPSTLVPRMMSLAHALSCGFDGGGFGCSEADYNEAIDIFLRALPMAPQAGRLCLEGLTQCLEDDALTAGRDDVALRVLTIAYEHCTNGQIRNLSHHAWNSCFMWFRSKGAKSKRARASLEKAVSLMPEVYGMLADKVLLEDTNGSPAQNYCSNYSGLWNAMPGAIDWMREEGREAYEAAMEKQRRGGAATDVYAHSIRTVTVSNSEGTTSMFGLEDIQDMQRDLAEVEAVSAAMPAVPDQERVLCDGCMLASPKLRKCTGCGQKRYCSTGALPCENTTGEPTRKCMTCSCAALGAANPPSAFLTST